LTFFETFSGVAAEKRQSHTAEEIVCARLIDAMHFRGLSWILRCGQFTPGLMEGSGRFSMGLFGIQK
jgi:hypothetical protein